MNQLLRPMLKLKEVADLLRISERTARTYLKDAPERLPRPINLTPGSQRSAWRFFEDDVYDFITKGNKHLLKRE